MNELDPKLWFWRARKTLFEILTMRGYDIDMSEISTVKDLQNENLDDLKEKFERIVQLPNSKNYLLIYWATQGKIGRDTIITLTEKMKKENVSKALLIMNGKISAYANGVISSLKVQKMYIEIFTEKELQINVTENFNVPLHQICSEEEKTEEFMKYSIKADQCPRILTTDIMVRYLGATKGQLIKITRPCETTPEIGGEKKYYITYRIVS